MRSSVTAGLIVSGAVAGCGGGGGIRINQDAQPVAGRWNAVLATPAQLAGVTQVRGTGGMGTREKATTHTEAHVALATAAPGSAARIAESLDPPTHTRCSR